MSIPFVRSDFSNFFFQLNKGSELKWGCGDPNLPGGCKHKVW